MDLAGVRARGARAGAVCLLLLLPPSSLALAGPLRADWTAALGAGHDSNPMRVAEDGPNGAFVELDLRGSLSRRVTRSSGWFLAGRVGTRAFDGATDLADRRRADVRAGWSFKPPTRRIALAVGLTHELDRSTYIDRETGTRFFVDDGAGGAVDVGGRYDRDVSGIFFNTRYKASKRLRLSLRTSLETSRFVEDYRAAAGLDPLDSTALRVRPELRWSFDGGVDLALGVERTTVDYDDRPALDESGTPVAGVTRRYEYTSLVAGVRYEPSERWSLRAGYRLRERADAYAGYYDYDGDSGFAALERSLGPRGSLEFLASRGTTDYERATVEVAGEDEARGGTTTRWSARYRHELSGRMRLVVEGGGSESDDRDPVYAYERTWTAVGIEFSK